MSGKIRYEEQGGILIARMVGEVNFGPRGAFGWKNLISKAQEHAEAGGKGVLFEFSEMRLGDPESYEFIGVPFMQIREHCRTAASFGPNRQLYETLVQTQILTLVNCFISEGEAIEFLLSDEPPINPAQHEHDLWINIGEEVGPEKCRRSGCNALRVSFSVLCRRHHYIMLKGVNYIGDKDN